jgi:membrane protein required for colicin V production
VTPITLATFTTIEWEINVMNALDIIIIAIIGFFTIFGFFKGFIRGASALVGVAGGIVAANLFYSPFAKILSQLISSMQIANALAYALIFFTTMVAVTIIGRFLEKLIKLIFLGWLNRLLGLVFGFAKGAMVAAVLLLLLTLALPPHHDFIAKSQIRPYFEHAYAIVPDNFRQQLIEKKEAIEKYLKEKSTP